MRRGALLPLEPQQPPRIGEIEEALRPLGHTWVIGADEAGRGPLAGPVVAAALCLDPERIPAGLNDSKKVSEKVRERLFAELCQEARAYAVVIKDAAFIDEVNILEASLQAMAEAADQVFKALCSQSILATRLLIDGNCALGHRVHTCRSVFQQPIVKGDARAWAIAGASILAKVSRDRIMHLLDAQYPGYGFATHKGYPTAQHRAALRRLGPTPVHRLSFRGVEQP